MLQRTLGKAVRELAPGRLLLVLAAFIAWAGPLARAGNLEDKLLDEAPKVLDYMKTKKNCGAVGVLKGRVFKDGRFSDNIGPINMNFARRLEKALLVAGDPEKHEGIVLLSDASAVAASLDGANHQTPEGIRKLFAGRYVPHWGKERNAVQATGFVTGTLRFNKDLTELNVKILAIGKDGGPPSKITEFTVETDLELLAECGEGFSLKGIFDGGMVEESKLVKAALKDVHKQKEKDSYTKPVALRTNNELLVCLDIAYVDKADAQNARGSNRAFDLSRLKHRKVTIEPRNQQAVIAEPNEDEVVYLVLRRADPKYKGKIGVVIMINGESLINKEKGSPEHCRKWILEEEDQSMVLTGYYTDKGTRSGKPEWEELRVASAEESKAVAMNYGDKLGQISIHAFVEGTEDPSAEEKIRQVVHKQVSSGPPKGLVAANWEDLKQQLRPADDPLGVIVPGGKFERPVNIVPFKNPRLCSCATLTYYKP